MHYLVMHTNAVMVIEIVTISAGTRPPNTLPTAFEPLVGDDDDDGDGDGDGDVGDRTNGEEERCYYLQRLRKTLLQHNLFVLIFDT